MPWLFTEYDVAQNSHVLHSNFSIPRAMSKAVNSNAILYNSWSVENDRTCPKTNEPHRDKTKKMACGPAKTQISLGIRPVWSESSLSAWRKLGSLATH